MIDPLLISILAFVALILQIVECLAEWKHYKNVPVKRYTKPATLLLTLTLLIVSGFSARANYVRSLPRTLHSAEADSANLRRFWPTKILVSCISNKLATQTYFLELTKMLDAVPWTGAANGCGSISTGVASPIDIQYITSGKDAAYGLADVLRREGEEVVVTEAHGPITWTPPSNPMNAGKVGLPQLQMPMPIQMDLSMTLHDR